MMQLMHHVIGHIGCSLIVFQLDDNRIVKAEQKSFANSKEIHQKLSGGQKKNEIKDDSLWYEEDLYNPGIAE